MNSLTFRDETGIVANEKNNNLNVGNFQDYEQVFEQDFDPKNSHVHPKKNELLNPQEFPKYSLDYLTEGNFEKDWGIEERNQKMESRNL